jgi:hypothetical protein
MSEISSGTVLITGPAEAPDARRQAFERVALGVLGAVANGSAATITIDMAAILGSRVTQVRAEFASQARGSAVAVAAQDTPLCPVTTAPCPRSRSAPIGGSARVLIEGFFITQRNRPFPP